MDVLMAFMLSDARHQIVLQVARALGIDDPDVHLAHVLNVAREQTETLRLIREALSGPHTGPAWLKEVKQNGPGEDSKTH